MEQMTEPAYRVRVNLSRFFDDDRSLCYMSVHGGRRVRWLQRRLRRLFALPRRLVIPLAVGRNWTFGEKSTESTITSDIPDQEADIQENNENIMMMSECGEVNVTVNDERGKMNDSCVSDSDCSKSIINNDICYSKDDVDGLEMLREDENLKQIKDKALALLEKFQEQSNENLLLETSQEQCNEKLQINFQRNTDISSNQDRPRRVRRRVRRRRPCAVPGSTATTLPKEITSLTEKLQKNDSESQSSIQSPTAPHTTTASLYSGHVAATVVQNSKVAPRTARLVRPLGQEPCIETTIAY
ncbi:unnamed protein product [Chilo suppressalis]|uniref:Uncharacterized protein n=1 Tax=Chilo suppressalis TaxID=168631 RepID=A0ABN8B955_CHISP|nr:unnamed protein product [Chilo suppressalis]